MIIVGMIIVLCGVVMIMKMIMKMIMLMYI